MTFVISGLTPPPPKMTNVIFFFFFFNEGFPYLKGNFSLVLLKRDEGSLYSPLKSGDLVYCCQNYFLWLEVFSKGLVEPKFKVIVMTDTSQACLINKCFSRGWQKYFLNVFLGYSKLLGIQDGLVCGCFAYNWRQIWNSFTLTYDATCLQNEDLSTKCQEHFQHWHSPSN